MRSHSLIKTIFFSFIMILALFMMTGQAQAGFFSLLKTKTPASVDIEQVLLAKVAAELQARSFSSYRELRVGSQTEFEKASLVQTNTHTEIIPEYSEAGLTFRFRYDDNALSKPENILKDLAVLSMINLGKGKTSGIFLGIPDAKILRQVESPHAVAELISNASAGSPTARFRWVSLQVELLRNVRLDTQILQDLKLHPDVITQVRASLETQLPDLQAAAIKHLKRQQKALDQWKSQTGTLDKLEAMEDKLDDLILKNDRKGVRRLLEAYLPWAVMEPIEANTWKIWLDAIENPDSKNTTIAFRGLKYDTDKIQRQRTSQGEIYGFMSTVLTKNQGSYTRRLRSLSTNRQKNGDVGLSSGKEQILSVKMTDQMSAHARDPVASSFISFTYDPYVARGFMGPDQIKVERGEKITVPYGGLLVVKMDSRRMIPNVSSMFSSEIELLAPLIVFPDEVVAYKEGSFNHLQTFESFVRNVSEKTGINFSSWATAKDSTDESLKARYKREGHAFLKQMTEIQNLGKSCSKVF